MGASRKTIPSLNTHARHSAFQEEVSVAPPLDWEYCNPSLDCSC